MSEPALRVLVVDDEASIRKFLRASLAAQDYQVYEAATGQDALSAVLAHRRDLMILDLGLPDIEGIEVTRQLREWSQIPAIILSVREHESEKVAALDAGADDYLTKPFGISELLARMRAALRRRLAESDAPVFTTGELTVDLARHVVTVAGQEVQLTPTEYDLLRALVTNAGKVITHRQLLHQVWVVAYEQEAHLLRVKISNLRHKLEADPTRPRYIVTEPGVGYRLRAEG
jgi:two-component system KDP operon response regulator KdpE